MRLEEALGCGWGLLRKTPGAHSVGLMQVWPNPFSATASIRFALRDRTRTTLWVCDLSGRRVRTLIDADLSPGEHRVAWDGRDDNGRLVASGVYFCRLSTGPHHWQNKIMLLK